MYADDSYLTYAGSNVDNIQFYLNQDLELSTIGWEQTS